MRKMSRDEVAEKTRGLLGLGLPFNIYVSDLPVASENEVGFEASVECLTAPQMQSVIAFAESNGFDASPNRRSIDLL